MSGKTEADFDSGDRVSDVVEHWDFASLSVDICVLVLTCCKAVAVIPKEIDGGLESIISCEL